MDFDLHANKVDRKLLLNLTMGAAAIVFKSASTSHVYLLLISNVTVIVITVSKCYLR